MTVYIKFITPYTVQPSGPSYNVGDVIEVSEPSAVHFESRGAAERCDPPAPKVAPKGRGRPPKVQRFGP